MTAPATSSITVYSKPSCVQCNATYLALEKRGIVFEKVDLSEDEAAYQRMMDAGHLQAPIVETPQGVWTGFRPDLIDKL